MRALGWKDPCGGHWRGPAELLSDPHMGQGILRPSPAGHWLPSLSMFCISVFLPSDSLKFTCFCYSRKKQKVNTRLQPSRAPKPSLFCLPTGAAPVSVQRRVEQHLLSPARFVFTL